MLLPSSHNTMLHPNLSTTMHRHQLPNEVAFSFSVTIKMEQLLARVDCFDSLMLI